MRSDARERLVREEGGFTLTEMMVTIVIMIVVLFALYSIFDMSIRVFSFGNDKIEAMERPGWAWRRWSGKSGPATRVGSRILF